MSKAKVQDRLLHHLWTFQGFADDPIAPWAICQDGIAAAIGISRSHLPRALGPLVRMGIVDTTTKRVRRSRRRRQAYSLSRKGLAYFQDLPARYPRLEQPVREAFHGRAKELLALQAFVAGPPGLLLLTGLPGIGKTALVREAFADHDGTCWLDLAKEDPAETLVVSLAAFLAARGPRFLPFLVQNAPSTQAALDMVGEELARQQPIVVVDGSIPPGSGLDRLGLMGGYWVVAVRVAQDLARLAITSISLGPLEEEAIVALLAGLGLPVTSWLVDQSGGHPLILRSLALARGSQENAVVPERILLEFVANLPHPERRILGAAAVYRQPVEARGLITDPDVDPGLIEELVSRHALLRSGDVSRPRYLIPKHLRQAVEEGLGPAEIVDGHLAAARYLQALRDPVSRGERIRHLAAGGHHRRAAATARRHGVKLLEAGLHDLLGEGLAAIDETVIRAGERIHLRFLRGNILEAQGDWAGAEEMYKDLTELAKDPLITAHALRKLGSIAARRQDLAAAEDLFLAAREATKEIADPAEVAPVLDGLGDTYRRQGRLDEATRLVEEALATARTGQDPGLEARIIHSLANLALQKGDLDSARHHYEACLAIMEAAPSIPLRSLALGNLGLVARRQGRLGEAVHLLEESVALARESGDIRVVYGLNNLAGLDLRLGDLAKAREHAEECQRFARLAGIRLLGSTTANTLAKVALITGDVDTAFEHLYASRTIRQELGDRSGEAEAEALLGEAFARGGDFADARRCFLAAIGIDDGAGDGMARARLGLVWQALEAGGEPAPAHLRALEEIGETLGEDLGWLWSRITARLAQQHGDPEAAVDILREALKGPRFPLSQTFLRIELAKAWSDLGRPARAQACLAQALTRARALGATPEIAMLTGQLFPEGLAHPR